jgi:prolipoprotein diacylglyceryltransferase
MLVHPQFDPIAIDLTKLGLPVAIHWYGITYLVAFGLFLYLAVRRSRLPHFAAAGWTRRDVEDLLFYGVLGTVIGGRLGYVLFYKPATTRATRSRSSPSGRAGWPSMAGCSACSPRSRSMPTFASAASSR